jgi:hypothetical protein
MKGEYKISYQIELGESHPPTFKTRHYHGNKVERPASFLQIAGYPDEEGYYLLYLDELKKEITDTFHETIEAAMQQAEWEYGVRPTEWEFINS